MTMAELIELQLAFDRVWAALGKPDLQTGDIRFVIAAFVRGVGPKIILAASPREIREVAQAFWVQHADPLLRL